MDLRFKEWIKKYHNEKIVNINDYLDDSDKYLLKKLGIIIKDKIYTLHEYDMVLFQMLEYYTDEEEQKIFKKMDFQYLKSLEEKNITREDFNKVLEKLMKMKDLKGVNL